MAQGTLWFLPIQVAFRAGIVVPGSKAYFYLAGSTTPVSVYADVGLTTALTQPVVADANGVFVEIFLTPGTAYKVDVQTSAGVSLTGYPADNQLAVPASSANVDVTGTPGENITAGSAVYLSDGSGGKNSGQWYKADAANTYSSTLPRAAMAPNALTSGVPGTIRVGGQVTGLTVAAGTDYFIGTAGAITATAPANARFLGTADSNTSLLIGVNQAVKGQTFTSPVVQTSMITPAAGLFYGCCGGRLTLTTALAVTTADVTGATSVFFTPYTASPFCGNIGLYDGSANWTILPFAELTCALGTITSGLPYDIFAYNNAGAVALRAPVAWTSTTARATALVAQNGVLVKTGATTDRYLGTFYTTSTTQTEDSAANRFLYNEYNPVPRVLGKYNTGSYTYTTGTWREAAGSTTHRVNFITGFAERAVKLEAMSLASNATANAQLAGAIGLDATTAPTPANQRMSLFQVAAAGAQQFPIASALETIPSVGFHFASQLEFSSATGTTTWYDNAAITGQQAGIGGILYQ